MTTKSHFGFKKSKAYGLCGAVLATFVLVSGANLAYADEVDLVSAETAPLGSSESIKQTPIESAVAEVISTETTSSETLSLSEAVLSVTSSQVALAQSEITQSMAGSTETAANQMTSIASVASSESTATEVSSNNSLQVTTEVSGEGFRSATPQSNRLDKTTSNFLTGIKKGSLDSIKEGILPSITAAQAILESGWGKSTLAKAPNHNLFGIKASEDWTGETVTVPTKEFVNGKYVTVDAAFRKYPSWDESVLDHAKFFTSTDWRKNNYKKVLGETDYKIAAQEIKNAGYATDPEYAKKLIRVIETYGLNEWDKLALRPNHPTNTTSVFRAAGSESDKNSVEVKETSEGFLVKLTSNSVQDFTKVQFAVWSEVNGGDDLKWYGASKEGTVLVPYKDHKDYGKYNVHTYTYESGSARALNAMTFDVAQPKVTVDVEKTNDFNYRVTIKDVPYYMSSVTVPVWTDKNGGDDLKWYPAKQLGDKTWFVDVPLSEHNFETGKYFADIYGNSLLENNRQIALGGRHFDVLSNPGLSSQVTTTQVSGKTVSLQYNRPIAAGESVTFAVWSDKNGGDDLVWYTADAKGHASVDLSRHKDYGKYFVHTYSKVNNQMVARDGHSFEVVLPELSVTFKKTSNKTELITISGVDKTFSSITVPVWSEKSGAKSLKWYDAEKKTDGTYQVTVNTDNHFNDSGHYFAHVYGQSLITGNLIGISGSTGFTSDAIFAEAKMKDYSENNKVFNVEVDGKNSNQKLTGVRIAVWSDETKGKDLKWYTPQVSNNAASQRISIANHANKSGHYIVHVYTDYANGLMHSVNLGTYKITLPEEKNVVTAEETPKGISLKLSSNSVGDYSKVQFAVWSEVDGGDDLKWYSASSDGTVVVPYANHKGYGKYNVHTYTYENGSPRALNAMTFDIAKPSAKALVSKVTDYAYEVKVTDVPYYISGVTVPVWTNKNGGDDLKWYSATKKDNSWVVRIPLNNHNFEKDLYFADIYGNSQLENNKLIALGGTSFQVTDVPKPGQPDVKVVGHDSKKGTITVEITELETSSKLKSVRLAAWSDPSGSNLHWYTTENVDSGKVSIVVNARNHKYLKGNYTVHVYVDTKDGQTHAYNLGEYDLQAEKVGSASRGNYDVINKVVYLDAGHGGYDPGASYYGINEKSLTLAIQNRVKAKLEAAGYQVVTARTTDTYVDLMDRSRSANASESDIFVSIHINASGSPAAQGIETYYYQYDPAYQPKINGTFHNNATRLNMSANLANAIQSNLVNATGAQNLGVKRETFAVLRETTAPAVLLELGFLSNPTEANRLNSATYQETLANAIVSGIKRYYSIYN